MVLVASWVSRRSASSVLVLIAWPSCSSRELITAAEFVARLLIVRSASPVVALIVWLKCSSPRTQQLGGSAAPFLDFLGHGVGATEQQFFEAHDPRVDRRGDLVAREPSALSMSSILPPMLSASWAPRTLITLVTSAMRLSSAPTTSLPPSAIVLAMSMTREASASLSVWVRPSIASRKRTNCWSRLAVTSPIWW